MARIEDRDQDRPPSGADSAKALLLKVLALVSFAGAAIGAGALVVNAAEWDRGKSMAVALYAMLALIGSVAVWSLKWFAPPPGVDEPVSPATRKTNRLFALSGLVAVPGALALTFGSLSRNEPFGMFSNGPVSPTIAIVAIASWVLGMTISLLWHLSADEHERKAYEFGCLCGFYLFTVATPVWWIAARGGLLGAPDAMILWVALTAVSLLGWFWHRYR